MLPEIKYWSVNWKDGMKISDAHFVASEQSHRDMLRDAIALRLTHFNYGLLPPSPEARSSFEMQFTADQSKLIRVRLSECRAVTAGGARIEITSDNLSKEVRAFQSEIETTFKVKSPSTAQYDIVLVVNPFARNPAGLPDPQESPVRYPYALPEYRLEILPSEQVNQTIPAPFNLTIGKINVMGDELTLDESFIPACTFITSYQPLKAEYDALTTQLFEIGAAAIQIVQKIKAEPKKTDLANNIFYLAEKVLSYLSMVIPQHRMSIAEGPPVMMFEKLSSLGYVVSAAVSSLPDKDREKMFNYFKQWIEMSQSQFEGAVMGVMNVEYNHMNMAPALRTVIRFVSVLNKLFKQLSKLKFIGEQKDSGLVIGEILEPPVTQSLYNPKPQPQQKTEEPEKKKAGGWSFLVD